MDLKKTCLFMVLNSFSWFPPLQRRSPAIPLHSCRWRGTFVIFVPHIGHGTLFLPDLSRHIPNDEFPHTWFFVGCLALANQRSDRLCRYRNRSYDPTVSGNR